MVETAKAASGGDFQRQVALLEQRLRGLPLPEIVGFHQILDELHAESFGRELWGAAAAIEPCSEDAFFAFRGWLIAQGRHIYDAAVADPDSLADLAELRGDRPRFERLPWGEALWGVAMSAYEARTGEEIPGLCGWSSRPFEGWWPFEQHEAELQRRYPRLWARFQAAGPSTSEQTR
jgi:hypothetical protein